MIYVNIVTTDYVNKLCSYNTIEAAAIDIRGEKYERGVMEESQLHLVEDLTKKGEISGYLEFKWCDSKSLAKERYVMLKRAYRKRWNW